MNGLLSRFLGRTVSIGSPAILELFGAGTVTAAGLRVNEETAMRNMAVWRAVNLTASTVADLPLEVFRESAGSPPVQIDPPLFRGEAYPDLGWPEFTETQMLHLLLYGNAYALKIWNEAGTSVVRVLPLDPAGVSVDRERPTPANPSGKVFKVRAGGETATYTPFEVLHVPGLSYDGLVGLSPIGAAKEAIGVALAAESVAGRMFDSGLLSGGILKADVPLTEEQATAAKQRWREQTSGVVRAHEIAIVSEAFTFTPTQMPPKDAQWLEARNFGVQEIARLYGVPADLLMENSATGNVNVEQRALFWVKFGLRHWVKRLESRYSAHLVPRGSKVKFNLDALLRGDSETQSKVFTAAINAEYLTVNEIRAILRRPPVPWGNEPRVPQPERPAMPAPAENEGEDSE